jgi:hypothetical protein
MITVKDFQKATKFPNACKDSVGSLRVGAAVGTSPETLDRVAALRAAGVDVVVVDTSHGHSRGLLEMVAKIKKTYSDIQVIGGNIVTAEAALDLVKYGATRSRWALDPDRSARRAWWPASECHKSAQYRESPRHSRAREFRSSATAAQCNALRRGTLLFLGSRFERIGGLHCVAGPLAIKAAK